jgi:hypothetical protein
MAMLMGLLIAAGGVALLHKMLKGRIWPQASTMKRGSEPKDQIIEIDGYEIVDNNQNQASEGHKVIID